MTRADWTVRVDERHDQEAVRPSSGSASKTHIFRDYLPFHLCVAIMREEHVRSPVCAHHATLDHHTNLKHATYRSPEGPLVVELYDMFIGTWSLGAYEAHVITSS